MQGLVAVFAKKISSKTQWLLSRDPNRLRSTFTESDLNPTATGKLEFRPLGLSRFIFSARLQPKLRKLVKNRKKLIKFENVCKTDSPVIGSDPEKVVSGVEES